MIFDIQRFADTDYLKDNLAGFVPQEMSYDIIGRIVRGSSILRLAKVETMTADTKKFSVFNSGASAYWVDETERIGVGVPQWSFPTIEAKKLAVIVPVTSEKLNDSVIDVFSEVQNAIAESFYSALDGACLFGTNSPFAQNVLSVATTNSMTVTRTAANKLDLDISDVLAKIEDKSFDATGFIANIAFKNSLRKLRDNNGNPLYVQNLLDANNNRYDTLYSLPIEFIRNGAWDADKAICVAGDWNYAVVGIRSEINYEVLREATLTTVTMSDNTPLSLAERDMIAIKATMRLGFAVTKPEAFAVLTPNA